LVKIDMNDLVLSSLRTYWERLRAGRIAPYRAEIDPRQFEGALENMFIVERVSSDNLRIRLAGMKVCEMMGMEVRGMEPGLFVDAVDRLRFDRLLGVVMAEPAVVEISLTAGGRQRAAMLLMPLRSDFGEINRVLGCACGPAEIGGPLVLRIDEATISPIEQTGAVAEARQPLPGFAEDATAFAPAPAAAPLLRKIEGNPNAPARARDPVRRFRVIDNS
jgi:hypothetical protein